MNVEFLKDGKFIDNCEQANMPRVGEEVIIDYRQYKVLRVVWNYDTRNITISLGDT